MLRLHVKRDLHRPRAAPSEAEADGLLALRAVAIPTAELVAHGRLDDGRSFVITEDLTGYVAADKLLAGGRLSFQQILSPTAGLAGRLHAADAYHRDLYLCHFLVRPHDLDIRLIDCARVLVRPFWRQRWQVKDLAQFVYSTREHDISAALIDRWFVEYAQSAGLVVSPLLRRRIAFKAELIARHDRRLRQSQPNRNVSIPG